MFAYMHVLDMPLFHNTISDIFCSMSPFSNTDYRKSFLQKVSAEETVCFRFFNKDELLARVNSVLILCIPCAVNKDVDGEPIKGLAIKTKHEELS